MKVLPCPGPALAAVSSPPIAQVRWCAMVSPLPPLLREREVSTQGDDPDHHQQLCGDDRPAKLVPKDHSGIGLFYELIADMAKGSQPHAVYIATALAQQAQRDW
jgi:hypothetical protein